MTEHGALEPDIVDAARRRSAIERLAQAEFRCRPGASWPTRDIAGAPPGLLSVEPDAADAAKSLARPLVQRCRTGAHGSAVPGHVVLPAGPDRREGADRRAARRPLPDDRRAQGARRLWLPRAAARHRPLRPGARQRHLAVDRQLLPRRRGHLAHARLPRRGGAAGRHEPGALRLARALGHRPGRHHPHARHREQRQGDLRQVRRARARPGERHPQPVLRVR